MDSQTLAMTQHPALAQMQVLGQWLADTNELASQSPDTAAEWGRIQRVFESVTQRLDSSDPALIPAPALNNVHASLANIVSSLSTYHSSRNASYLQQANNQCNDLLYHAAFIPGVEFKKARKSLLSYMGDYANAVNQHTSELEAKTREGLESIAELKAQVADLQAQVEKQSAEAMVSSKKLDEDFEKAQESWETAFDTVEEERAKAFQMAESTRNESLSIDLKKHRDSVDRLLTEKTEEAEQLRTEIKTQAEALVAQLKSFKDQAEDLVGLTGTLTRANAYREAAKDESLRGWIWSGVAAVALITLSVVAFRTLWIYTNGAHLPGIDWSGFSIRLFTLFSLTALAYYAGRQGEIHRNAERQNRRLFSDLASISPFLSELAPEKREAIIEEVAMRIFGQPDTPTEPLQQSLLLSPERLGKLVDLGTDAAGKVIKGMK